MTCSLLNVVFKKKIEEESHFLKQVIRGMDPAVLFKILIVWRRIYF